MEFCENSSKSRWYVYLNNIKYEIGKENEWDGYDNASR